MSLSPTQLFAVLTPTQQLSATLHETGPAGPEGPPGPPGADGLPHIIQDEGVALAPFDTLNFAGAGVTASVDTPGARITVTIPGGSQTPWVSNIDGGGFELSNASVVRATNLYLPHTDSVRWWITSSASANLNFGRFSAAGAFLDYPVVVTSAGYTIVYGFDCQHECTLNSINGNTGIGGTPHATYRLNVTGDVNITGQYRINGVVTGAQTPWVSDIDGGNFKLHNVNRLGIAKYSPSVALDVTGDAVISGGITSASMSASTSMVSPVMVVNAANATGGVTNRIEPWINVLYIIAEPGATGSASMAFRTGVAGGGAIDQMTISAIGNLGLPTPHATYKLNVTGDCNLSAGSSYRVNAVVSVGTLPTSAPAAGSKGLWVDAADSNRVKYVT